MRQLNIGCGTDLKADFVNIDKIKWNSLVLQRDVRYGLPFDTESVDFIYTSHFLEHLESGAECIRFLEECLRVLKQGSLLEIHVPYGRGVDAFMPDHKSYWTEQSFNILVNDPYQGDLNNFRIEFMQHVDYRDELVVKLRKV